MESFKSESHNTNPMEMYKIFNIKLNVHTITLNFVYLKINEDKNSDFGNVVGTIIHK